MVSSWLCVFPVPITLKQWAHKTSLATFPVGIHCNSLRHIIVLECLINPIC